jgi:hypothetical protein
MGHGNTDNNFESLRIFEVYPFRISTVSQAVLREDFGDRIQSVNANDRIIYLSQY